MNAGDQHQRREPLPGLYLDERGRYRDELARPDPPDAGDETAPLLGFLERQRATFAWKCGGLDAAGLRASVGASAMTLGVVPKHLARFEDDMSAEWMHGRAQRPAWDAVDWAADHDRDWRSAADDPPERLYARWRDAVARSRSLIAEALADGGPERRGGGISDAGSGPELPSLRYVLINLIESTPGTTGMPTSSGSRWTVSSATIRRGDRSPATRPDGTRPEPDRARRDGPRQRRTG